MVSTRQCNNKSQQQQQQQQANSGEKESHQLGPNIVKYLENLTENSTKWQT